MPITTPGGEERTSRQVIRRAYGEGVRAIPDPGCAGDDGSVDPLVAEAVEAVQQGAPLEQAIAALVGSRVLIPVVAMLDEVEHDNAVFAEVGRAHDKSAHMAAVLLTGRDGRRALLAFSSLASLRRWNPDARPVPINVRQAAQAALAESADALVVDVAGPVMVPVEGDDLHGLARGMALMRVDEGYAWVAEP